MSSRARIFPPAPPRDGNLLRLGLVGSWESHLVGLGRLTAFLTPRLLKQSHAVDDMGLYVVFLQRHRVEVGLKLVLERARAPIPNTHAIEALVNACDTACAAVGYGSEFRAFAASQQEYIGLIDEVDPGAATFRYPVDAKAQPWARQELVDLQALEEAGKEFQDAPRPNHPPKRARGPSYLGGRRRRGARTARARAPLSEPCLVSEQTDGGAKGGVRAAGPW